MSEFQTAVSLIPIPCSLTTEEASAASSTVASILWNLVTPEGSSAPPPMPTWSYELKERFSLSLSEDGRLANSTSQHSPTTSRIPRPIESPLTCYAQAQTARAPAKPVVMATSQENLQPNISKAEVGSGSPLQSVSTPHPRKAEDLPAPSASRETSKETSTTKTTQQNGSTSPRTGLTQEKASTAPNMFSTATAIVQPQVGLRVHEDPQQDKEQHQRRDDHEDDPLEVEGTGPKRTERKVSHLAAHYFQSIPSRATSGDIRINDSVTEFLSSVSPALSEMLGRQASHFDILLICIALMKLDLESQEEEKLSRRVERTMQLRYLENEALNLKSQAKSLLFSHVGAGVLGVAGGFLPILGIMKGDSILNGLSGVFGSLSGKKSKDVFDGLSKMMQSISETQKASGQIYGTFAEADRTRYNRFGDIHSRDQEERTRALEQLQEKFRGMERFLTDLLQMRHDVASQLYR